MTEAALFTTALALAFAAVLGLVLFSGRLSAAGRRQLERGLAWVVAPVMFGFWVWLTVQAVQLKSMPLIGGQVVIGVLLTVQCVRFVRKRGAKPGTIA